MSETIYTFWMGARKYQTTKPKLTGREIKEMDNAALAYPLFKDNFGEKPDKGISDGENVSVAGEPHFYCAPPGTTVPSVSW